MTKGTMKSKGRSYPPVLGPGSAAAAWFPLLLAFQMMQPGRSPRRVRKQRAARPPVEASGVEPSSSSTGMMLSDVGSTVPPAQQIPPLPLPVVATPAQISLQCDEVQVPPVASDPAPGSLGHRFQQACSCQLHDFLQWSALPRPSFENKTVNNMHF